MRQHNAHKLYRAVLRLYPKAHRKEYGEQMAQTFDDIMADRETTSEQWAVWLRVVFELPSNLAEEHINNIRGMDMNSIKRVNKKVIVGIGVVIIAVIAGTLFAMLHNNNQYAPTTLSKVPRATTPPPCIQTSDNKSLSVPSDDQTFIANAVASGIIDVPAGTNVEVYLKTYSGSKATGSAIYTGKYGTYNFVATKTSNGTDSYLGGWSVTRLEACKS